MGGSFCFQNVPADFTKQDAMKQAQVLGINIKTLDYWLTKFVNSGDLQRIMNGKIPKSECIDSIIEFLESLEFLEFLRN